MDELLRAYRIILFSRWSVYLWTVLAIFAWGDVSLFWKNGFAAGNFIALAAMFSLLSADMIGARFMKTKTGPIHKLVINILG